MTREEFIENIDYFYELRDFCNDEDIDILDDYFDGDDLDDAIYSDMNEYAAEYSWQDLRDALSNISTGYDFYRRDGVLYFDGCGQPDFDELKERVLEIMDDRESWDRDDDDEDDDEDDEEEETIQMTEEELWWGKEEEEESEYESVKVV